MTSAAYRRLSARVRKAGAFACVLALSTGVPLPAPAVRVLASPAMAAPQADTAGTSSFAAVDLAIRESAAFPATGPHRTAGDVTALALRWNTAAQEAARVRLDEGVLRESWIERVEATADAWSNAALGASGAALPDTLPPAVADACALAGDVATFLPVVEAATAGRRTAFLLTTSVGCECEMLRADQMETVWTLLQSGEADQRRLLGRSDSAYSPFLPGAFELDRVPGWLLLGPSGEVVFRVDGGAGIDEVHAMILRWLSGEDLHP